MRVRLIFALATAIGLAACGGSAAVPTAAPAPTSPAPSTTTTVAATTTTTASTIPPTTSTTVDPTVKLIADFKGTLSAFNVCTANPAGCDVSTMSIPGSESYTNLTKFFAKLDANGLRGKPSSQDYVVIEAAEIAPDGRTATLRSCGFDAGTTYDPRGNDDPSDDVIVNDAIGSTRTTWTLGLVGGTWRRIAAIVELQKLGENVCPPASGS